jgi:hypothetical protein
MKYICGHCGKEKGTELGLCGECGRFPTSFRGTRIFHDDPIWVVGCGTGVRCNHCTERLEVPEQPNWQAEWHRQLCEFMERHVNCLPRVK